MTTLHLSRVRVRRSPSAQGLAALFDPPGENEQAPDMQRRALWTLFADTPDRERDFLWRADGKGKFFILSRRPPEDRHNLFDLDTQPFAPVLAAGDRLAFSLRVNPTRSKTLGDGRASRKRVDVVMDALHPVPQSQRAERRMDLAHEAGAAWLADKGAGNGFAPERVVAEAYRTIRLPRRQARDEKDIIKLGLLDLAGVIRVTDPDAFLAALATGIGRGRAFGCGLMLIRRAGPG